MTTSSSASLRRRHSSISSNASLNPDALRAAAFAGLESLENRVMFAVGLDPAVLPGVPISAAEVRHLKLEVVNVNGKQNYAFDGQFVASFDLAKGALKQRATTQTRIDANAAIGNLESAYGGQVQVTQRLGDDGLFLINAPSAVSTAQLKTALSSVAGFQFVEPNQLVWSKDRTPNDTSYGTQWAIPKISAPAAWDIATGQSDKIVVAVIDTGIDYNHPDLAGQMWTNPGEIPGDGQDNDLNGFVDDYYGYNFAGVRNSNPYDDNRHGTHVAGTIAAATDNARGIAGVSWGAKLMALKFLNSTGTGSTADATAAINYMSMMLERGVPVLVSNNSWSGPTYNQTLKDAIDRYSTAGGLFVAAAGNSGSSTLQYPAGYTSSNVISVAASDRNDNRPSFSNFGTSWVDLAAPGVDIYSTRPGNAYAFESGTSMAAPQVSGTAALLWDAAGRQTPRATIQNAILNGVDTLPQWSGLVATGGRLNVARSLNLLDLSFRVVSATPEAGVTLTSPLTQFNVSFTSSYLASSVQPSDFKVNGVSATSITQVDAKTLAFNYAVTPMTTSGTQTMSIAAGAISRTGDSRGVSAWTQTFKYDAILLDVISTTPSSGVTVPFPLTRFDVQFSEALDPSTVSANDLVTSAGSVTGATLIAPDTIRFTLTGVDDESIGAWTAVIYEDSLKDAFGFSNQTFVGALGIDAGSVTLNSVPSAAAGSSLVERLPTQLSGVINPSGDSDEFSIDLDAGQTLTAVVNTAVTLHAGIEFISPSGQSLSIGFADDIGQDAILQSAPIVEAGVYKLVVYGEQATLGSYSMDVYINAAVEEEGRDRPTNGTTNSAQNLDTAFGPLANTGADRVAVIGTLEPTGWTGSDRAIFFKQDFEATLDASWSTWSSNAQGRIQTSTEFGGYLSPGALLMDRTPGGAFTNNEAVWTVDLTGLQQPFLTFAQADLGDEEHTLTSTYTGRQNGDGVSVSTNGVNWYRVYTPGNLATGVWENVSVDLRAVAQQYGLTLGANFQVRFQQYDNLALPQDGRAYDAARITALAPPEDWYSFSATAGESLTVGFDVAGTSNAGLTLELFGPSGNLVASGVASDPAYDQLVENVTAGSTGTYNARIRGASVSANEYVLVVARGANLDAEPNNTTATGQDLGLGGAALGTVGPTDSADVYRIVARAGDVLTITTATPGDGPGLITNTLDPAINVLSSSGATLLSASAGNDDGRNVTTTYNVAQDGIYLVSVSPESGSGNYVLSVTGQTGGAVPFTVTGISPMNAALVVSPVTQLTVDFSQALNASTVQAGDIFVNGVPATLVSLNDKNTAVFTLPSPLVDGNYTVTMLAGAVRNLAGADVGLFQSTFRVDLTPPRLVQTSLAQGDFRDVGALTYTARFSESLRATGIIPANVLLLGTGRGVSYTPQSLVYDDTTLTVTATYTGLPEDAYQMTLKSGDGAFEDLAGLDLDGENTWPLPGAGSGNGVQGGDFVVNFGLEPSTSALSTAFAPVAPAGSMAYQQSVSSTIDFTGDLDRYTVDLQAGQVLTVAMRRTSGGLLPVVSILNPTDVSIGSTTASSGSGNAVTVTAQVAGAGTYTIVASGSGTGTYDLSFDLNSVAETEPVNGAPNDALQSAQSIDSSFISLSGGASRGMVRGTLESGGQDWYAFSVGGATSITLSLASSATSSLDIEVYNDAGDRLTQGFGGLSNSVAAVQNLSLAVAGTYYVRVLPTQLSAAGAYSLVVVQSATFDLESNDDTARAQDIGPRGVSIGNVGAGDVDLYKISVQSGNQLSISTFTPGDAAGLFDETLDPAVSLFDPSGALVESASAGATDGRNVVLNHTATSTGVYVLRVSAESGTAGEYVVRSTGQAGGFLPLTITDVSPLDGAILRAVPTSITLDFSHALLASSVGASDLLVNGIAASSFAFVDPNTVRFDVPGLTEGSHTISVAANTLLNLDGTANLAFGSTFRIDLTPPRVVSSSISSGQFFGIGSLTYTARFSETLVASQIDSADVALRGLGLGTDYSPQSFAYDAATSTLTLDYANLPEQAYQLTLKSGDGALEDIAGINLDGEATWPLPILGSGDGAEGGDFVVDFGLETITAAFPVPLTEVLPAGSLVHRGSVSSKIDFATDTDAFTIDLLGGQTFSVLVTGSASLAPSVRVESVGGTVIASGSTVGSTNAIVQNATIASSGTYRIVVGSANGATGNYTVTTQTNAAFEAEENGGATNDTAATAQSLDGAFVTLDGTTRQAAVTGRLSSAAVDRFAVLSDSFENGYGPGWTFAKSSTIGRTQLSTAYGGTNGQFAMLMDVSPATGSFARNEATWAVNIAGLNQPRLKFSHIDLGDEEHAMSTSFTTTPNGDGVAVSTNGINWRRIFQPAGVPEFAWGNHDYDLVAFAAANGLTLGGTLFVKFVQYDNLSVGSDGRGWDNVQITAAGTSDQYAINATTGQTISFGVRGEGSGAFDLKLFNAAGVEVVTGRATSAGANEFDTVIDEFTIPITGQYYVRVAASLSTAESYSLVALQNGTVAFETSSTIALGSSGAALGSLGTTSDNDSFSVNLTSGTTVVFGTSTFGPTPGSVLLDPVLTLVGPTGSVVATSDNDPAGDGRNSLLSFTVMTTGMYTLRVSAASGTGSYLVSRR